MQMENIGLLTNSITARMLMYQIDYVLNIPVKNIYVLSENHNKSEIFPTSGAKVTICDSYDEFIQKSELIITSNKQETLAHIDNRKLLFIDSPWNGYENHSMNGCLTKKLNYSNAPVVFILSIGDFTDQYHIEILVNKIVASKTKRIAQIFTPETKALLDSIAKSKNINPNLVNACNNNDGDVIIISANNISNDLELIQIIKEISPDYFILCVDYSFNGLNEVELFFSNICKTNIVVQSPYITNKLLEGKQWSVYCNVEKSNVFHNTLEKDFENYLELHIMQKIFMPNSIGFV
mgnify:FL=1